MIVAEALGTALLVVLLSAVLFLAGGVAYVVILGVTQAVKFARQSARENTAKGVRR
ncbi:hypothetical protein HOS58_gp30 [Streptomyces phage Attoomi]|uniref:Uncharacterized protein n=1 Tax=Streptomyces phage Attoomi TaxID=2059881 RepID=A0A2H5BLH8_9CAUD|nr:hypothetical protein HOS58_gp30 [Streptomyces phage Attoomi]AUG87162.1 hypothetical protein SEA_ATTOOMI_30 [Streptomyces phage Attoomi]